MLSNKCLKEVIIPKLLLTFAPIFYKYHARNEAYWVPQKLLQIYTVIAYICIGKVA